MMRTLLRLIGAAVFSAACAAFATWPQIRLLSTHTAAHHDAYFSIWRIAWIAHALASSPLDLFNANIFFPATRTMAYSDATLLEGLIAAPAFWLGVTPVLIYNVLLLAGFAGSGVGMFVLARHLTGATGPALVAAALFTLAPYRVEHFMHVELQWVMFAPLTLWALHRSVERGRRVDGVVAGLCLGLQTLACVYYGVFLGLLLVLFVPILLALSGRKAMAAIPALVVAAVIGAVIALPYAWVYAQVSSEIGTRPIADIQRYSALPVHYFAASGLSRLWGWTEDLGAPELRLFPGAMAILLGAAALLHRQRRWVALYVILLAAAVILSFGLNTPVYRWLAEYVTALRGLRSTSRFGIFAAGALAVLAAYGTQALQERTRMFRFAVVPLLLALIAVDGAIRDPDFSVVTPAEQSSLYKILRSAEPGVVVELPLPNLNRLPGWDAYYSLWSISHWHPLVNGYSGYYPIDYINTLARMESFPDDASVARLRAHQVRYIIVHHEFFGPDGYRAMLARIAGHSSFRSWGEYQDPVGIASLFVLEPE